MTTCSVKCWKTGHDLWADTGFLIAAEITEHSEHAAARDTLTRLLAGSHRLAIAPQVLAEFIHIATDPRRFARPLEIDLARRIAQQWWTASETIQVFPDAGAVQQFLAWLQQFALGRKRLLDTLLAATYLQAGIQSLLTTNSNDFNIFGVFNCVEPRTAGTP
jgi:predicted nucleic acid-binding protein